MYVPCTLCTVQVLFHKRDYRLLRSLAPSQLTRFVIFGTCEHRECNELMNMPLHHNVRLVLERGSFRTTVSDAVWAAYRRSLELGGKASNVGPGRNNVLPTFWQKDMKDDTS